MLGTVVNTLAVIVGSLLGLLLKGKFSEKTAQAMTKAIGLCVCIMGISGAMENIPGAKETILMVISLALGALVGECLKLDNGLARLGQALQNRVGKQGGSNIAEGFVASTLLFCVGAMSIVGAIEGGLRDNHGILYTKAILDGISSIVLASTLGIGVLISSLAVLAYQGAIVLFSSVLQTVLVDELVALISAVGSVMILGLGLNMALNANIKVANLLPSLLIAVAGYYLFWFIDCHSETLLHWLT